jgi:sRNA-binding regulator protein Hfq
MSENNLPFVQSEMFQKLLDAGATAAVFLKNGIRLVGKIKQFDSKDVFMTSINSPLGLAVARDAIATVGEFNPTKEQTGTMKQR